MNLPAVDLGIMTEHLSTHEGVIHKLKLYYSSVQNPVFKNLLGLHIKMLRNHVIAMLGLINPDPTHKVDLSEMDSINWNINLGTLEEYEKDIALEARSTAKQMGSDNFNSALMMKDADVKNIHLQMSYQDVSMQMMYDHLIKHTLGEFIPRVSKEMQRLTLQHYSHVQNE
ncbi:hypothetical protein [Bacillus sp. AG4(2022)]|uniref:hypothetical protein n=1 Tax=Bacillus sp. AG4(2022) TaxID=2962594 RepID=UPI002882352E|nr:hypothetical protein [Bacillus sp. AG4(2022)]MDT0163562.1 hypothetical protein [Bacillus sp. AG4(2022)]